MSDRVQDYIKTLIKEIKEKKFSNERTIITIVLSAYRHFLYDEELKIKYIIREMEEVHNLDLDKEK